MLNWLRGLHQKRSRRAIQRLPNGGTRVIYNGKTFDLAGRVIRADELAESTRIVQIVVDEGESCEIGAS